MLPNRDHPSCLQLAYFLASDIWHSTQFRWLGGKIEWMNDKQIVESFIQTIMDTLKLNKNSPQTALRVFKTALWPSMYSITTWWVSAKPAELKVILFDVLRHRQARVIFLCRLTVKFNYLCMAWRISYTHRITHVLLHPPSPIGSASMICHQMVSSMSSPVR